MFQSVSVRTRRLVIAALGSDSPEGILDYPIAFRKESLGMFIQNRKKRAPEIE